MKFFTLVFFTVLVFLCLAFAFTICNFIVLVVFYHICKRPSGPALLTSPPHPVETIPPNLTVDLNPLKLINDLIFVWKGVFSNCHQFSCCSSNFHISSPVKLFGFCVQHLVYYSCVLYPFPAIHAQTSFFSAPIKSGSF